MKAKSIIEITRELDAISDTEAIEVNLKKLLLVYKAIEDWRHFFHNSMHYPTIEELEKYVGDKKHGMYATINHIYMKTFEELLPGNIEDRLE